MKNNVSESFLLWTYFGLDGTETKEEILGLSIDAAYKDATRQGAFNTKVDKAMPIDNAKGKAKEYLLKALLEMASCASYDDWHRNVCCEIVSIFANIKDANKNIGAFLYGNAQKLVNMTLKYLHIIASAAKGAFDEWYQENVSKFEMQFHIPIDNFILQYLYESRIKSSKISMYRIAENGKYSIKKIQKNSQYAIVDGDNNVYSWSNIPSYVSYFEIMSEIRTLIHGAPIEWENRAWIDIAKKRRVKS